MDASTLGKRFTSLNLSVMYRGCGIPVAWIIIKAEQEGSWRPYWERLLQQVAEVVPKEWKVIVLADRGLYAGWLFTAIQQHGWHPFLRVNSTMGFRAEGEADFAAIGTRVRRRGRGWKGKGEWSEKGERVHGTLLIRWEKGYDEQVAVVTDLLEEETETAWYFVRFWIEDSYKDHKSGGFGWQQTKMQDPQTGRTALVGDGGGDADRGAGGRTGRGQGARAARAQDKAEQAAPAERSACQAGVETAWA